MTAIISPCGQYRYALYRHLAGTLTHYKPCLFVMLNPSTADALKDDPTIRRCISFAKREGCTDLTVVNLYAFRTCDPTRLAAELKRGADIVGPDNLLHISEQIAAHRMGIIVAAWGSHDIASGMLAAQCLIHSASAQCLGVTKDGSPRHPLYVNGDQPLVPWAGAP